MALNDGSGIRHESIKYCSDIVAHHQSRSPLHLHPASSINGEIKPNKPQDIPVVGPSNKDNHSNTVWKPTAFLGRVIDTANGPSHP